jgi:hypothetical protein
LDISFIVDLEPITGQPGSHSSIFRLQTAINMSMKNLK